MIEFSPTVNLAMSFVGAILCLSPLFFLNSNVVHRDDPTVFKTVSDLDILHCPSLMASFFIIIIPAGDLLLDLSACFSPYFAFDEENSAKKSSQSTVVVRLSDKERLVFIIGVCVQSCVWFFSVSNPNILGLIYTTTGNASSILVLGPVLTYLQRCTTTFTAWRVTTVIVVATIGLLTSAMCNLRVKNYSHQTVLYRFGLGTFAVSGALFIALVVLCAFKYCRLKLYSASDRKALLLWISTLFESSHRTCKNKKTSDKSKDRDYELYANCIPALHMASALTVIISEYYINTTTLDLPTAYERKNYIVIAAEICVLLIELRIRKHEIARGLIDLLESKKSYVRYISHELRTPLNTAFLGLKLLSSELKASKDPKDIERYDTLCDVNLSCTAAVDILNDMLCYEKLQSGILGLNKENIVVLPFLNNCVSMFSAQARECGVTISIDDTPCSDGIGVTGRRHSGSRSGSGKGIGNGSGSSKVQSSSLPLLPDDTIFADKFKMDQVIRNLISNALKFTPRGGTVKIRGTFLEMTEEELIKRSRAALVLKGNSWFSFRKFFRRKNSVGVVTDVVDEKGQKGTAICGKLLVVVTDTGAGIVEKNLGRLFKEIVQFNPEKLQAGGGSGLGLWITRGIVDLHDGTISASSGGEGMGSSFSVEIPMIRWIPANYSSSPSSNPKSSPPIPVRPSARASSKSLSLSIPPPLSIHLSNVILRTDSLSEPTSALSGRLHESFKGGDTPDQTAVQTSIHETTAPSTVPSELLVVDDSSLNRKMLLKCLRAAGHVCTEAGDGLEAIQAVKKRIGHSTGCEGKPFDAILMDFVMPNMDGPTATKEIRALGYTAPIFGLTGNGLPADVTYFLGCGADKVLLKPLDLNKFSLAMADIHESIT